ncbi:MAG TPA: TonB-dependent receptor [Holophagaceae bacterium]|jgi:outer membrane receptor for ferrienterochelin and colicins|nr:TonB-dependent receptor [Holophagaceae bacterium]
MRLKPLLPALLASPGLGAAMVQAPQVQEPAPSPQAMQNLLELMRTPVVSASRQAEPLSDAPATVIVLQRKDLEMRGYTELSQILDDLPGMDVVRPYGADYVKNYWRGYRTEIGDPYLVMVDGVVFNHLWFDTADTPLVTYPVSAIERVEVVYGPASALYGANAFMGVINIITRTPQDEGLQVHGRFTGGSFGARIGDFYAADKQGDLSFSIAARRDEGDVDESASSRYEYTKGSYYANRGLWGSVLDDPGLAGSPKSEHQHHAVDARLDWKGLELGIQQLWMDSGYGVAYAADESQSMGRWIRPETSVYLRYRSDLSDSLASTAMARFRRSDVDSGSYDVESYYGYGSGAASVITHYEVLNSSLAYTQDFELRAGDLLTFNGGFDLEQKTLQKAYLTTAAPAPLPGGALTDGNHFSVLDRAAYLQGRYRLSPGQQLTFGIRNDDDAIFGSATTLRGGYVLNAGPWGFKALYGQAYQQPIARYLYGGTSGTGSNLALHPERSNTAQLSGTWTLPSFGLSLDLYQVQNRAIIQKAGASVANTGDQDVTGSDLGVQAILPFAAVQEWKLWGYYSRTFHAVDRLAYPSPMEVPSGDMARDKVLVGTTVVFNSRFDTTLLARYIGRRATVPTNPVGEVGSYATLDLNVDVRDIGWKGLNAALRVANLTNRAYAHPGLRDAGAGTTPGAFNGATWAGSQSYYNSLLPQPGRSIQVSLFFDF